MLAVTLGLPGLPERQAGLRAGGLCWLTCESQETADRLCRQVIAGLSGSTRALLVNAAGSVRELLAGLPEEQGPGRLGLFDLRPRPPVPLIQALLKDVPRVREGDRALWLIRVSLKDWDELVAESLADWCRRAQAWLASVGSALLVIGDQPPPALLDILLRHNDCISGLGQVYIGQGERHLLQHFWRGDAGISGPHDYLMPREGEGFRVLPRPEAEEGTPTADDQRQVLAQAEVLGGEALPTPLWQLFTDVAELLDQALAAQAATVVFALGSSDDIPALAGHLHQLRKHCGRSLKLAVREVHPCLRQNDEQLLLANGANLVVTAAAPFLRFLALLRSIQGQRWQRVLAPEPSAVLMRLRPLPLRGSLSPRAFAAAVKKMTDNTAGTEVRNQLLRLQPLPALDGEQVLQQMQLSRDGDLACVAGGRVYLFLFACSNSALDAALRNVFRLPWQELLEGYETVTPYSVLPGAEFQSDSIPTASATPVEPQAAAPDHEAFQALRPKRIGLSTLEERP